MLVSKFNFHAARKRRSADGPVLTIATVPFAFSRVGTRAAIVVGWLMATIVAPPPAAAANATVTPARVAAWHFAESA